jgi:acid phosphatase (class A)
MKIKIKNVFKSHFSAAVILLSLNAACAQKAANLEIEPADRHYAALARHSPQPNPSRAWMDTLFFPWKEYGKSALSYSLYRTVYLSAEDEKKIEQLAKSLLPRNSSDQTKAEMDYLIDLQNKVSEKDLEKSDELAHIGSWIVLNPTDPYQSKNLSNLFHIAKPVGDWFNPENFPAVTRLMNRTIHDIRVTEFRLKKEFRRPRPAHLDSRIKNSIDSPAYPSGHTLFAFAQAYLFANIIPSMRSAFIERAEEIRWSREALGIHYPSDNEASRQIAGLMLKLWMNNPDFVKDYEAAKSEWKEKSRKFSYHKSISN